MHLLSSPRAVRSLRLLLVLVSLALSLATSASFYYRINGLLCINAQFVETHADAKSSMKCSSLCSSRQQCQAFSMADGPCKLFVFDRCSKSVRDCGCSRTGQLFVKLQSGLPPGALCPARYASDSCGVKYKFMSCVGNWTRCKAMCDAEPGLVIMADVTDLNERNKVTLMVASKLSSFPAGSGFSAIYLGGWQLPGSPEQSGGWQWVSCGLGISSGLWGSGEPNNGGGVEDRAATDYFKELIDLPAQKYQASAGGYCECLSPFG